MENTLTFVNQLGLIQFLIPPICSGILFAGLCMYGYMYFRYKNEIYLGITVLIVLALLFTGSETMVLSFGSWLHNRSVSLQFHRIEQLTGVFFLAALPFFLSYLLEMNKKWHFVNYIIAYTGLVFAIVAAVVAFVLPDYFISMQGHKATWLFYEADYGRGVEGIVYHIRDSLLGVYIVYAIISITIDAIWHKNIKHQLPPVIGLMFAFLGAINDTYFVYSGTNLDFFPDKYFSRFTIGITIMMLFFMSTVTRRFIDTAKKLEEAHTIISISEERYRYLVESTNDCIISLSTDLDLLSANKAAFKQLAIPHGNLSDCTFYDLLYTDMEDMELTNMFIKDKIDLFLSKKEAVTFKAYLKIHGTNEPREYHIRFENIMAHDKNEILMKAATYSNDTLMRYLDSEKITFSIDNYIALAEEISKRLVLNLPKYIDNHNVMTLQLGLREIIINAIEHGNLNISFDEKTEVCMNTDYIQFINERQKDSKYKDKKVHIDFSLTADRVKYLIKDEGEGFDYRKMVSYMKQNSKTQDLAHGRGLTMAYNIFDEVIFNKKGNEVLLVKKFGTQGNVKT